MAAVEEGVLMNERRLSHVESEITGLKRWQTSQNGAIHRVEGAVTDVNNKLDRLIMWMLGATVSALAALAVGLLLALK